MDDKNHNISKSNLYERFLKNLQQNHFENRSRRLMLAVSGGVDSMVMLSLFHRAGFDCVVAHCNFSLRGEESDGDEALVRSICEKYNFVCRTIRFDTLDYANRNKLSIEMAARDLRYNWFADLRRTENIDFTVVAHNKNDLVETVLINLTRGTGLKGLTGMQFTNDTIIRPLLFAERVDIEQYARENNISYRTDSSNLENEYTRNKFRNIIIPELKKINPSVINSIAETAAHLNDCSKIYNRSIEDISARLVSEKNGIKSISIVDLLQTSSPQTILYEILGDYGFSGNQVADIFESCKSQSGKKFYSERFVVYKDRECFLLSPLQNNIFEEIIIESPNVLIDYPMCVEQHLLKNSSEICLQTPSNEAMFDFDKLKFPLTIRRWREGDVFRPFGMKGSKKISDFLIDKKIPLLEKEKIFVLCSNNQIVWLIGFRISEIAKVDAQTQNVLNVKINPISLNKK